MPRAARPPETGLPVVGEAGGRGSGVRRADAPRRRLWPSLHGVLLLCTAQVLAHEDADWGATPPYSPVLTSSPLQKACLQVISEVLEVRASAYGRCGAGCSAAPAPSRPWALLLGGRLPAGPLGKARGTQRGRAPGAHGACRCGRRSNSVSVVETRTAASSWAVVISTEKRDGDVFWKLQLCCKLNAASLKKKNPRGSRRQRRKEHRK